MCVSRVYKNGEAKKKKKKISVLLATIYLYNIMFVVCQWYGKSEILTSFFLLCIVVYIIHIENSVTHEKSISTHA